MRVSSAPALAVLSLAILPLACGSGASDAGGAGGAEPGAATDTTIPSRTPSPVATMPEPTPDSLRLSLGMPDEVAAGEPVRMTLRVENVTDRTLTLHLVGRTIAFDLIVERADGSAVWRRLEGEVVSQILRLDTLAPGDALVFEDTWAQRTDAGEPAPPGEYRVRAELPTEADPLVTDARPLRILPS